MKDIDLTPRENRIQQRVSPAQFTFVALLVAGLVFLGAETGIYWLRYQEVRADLSSVEARMASMAEQVREAEALQREISDIASYMATMQALVARQVPWDEVLSDVAARIPRNVWLGKVTIEPNLVQVLGYAPTHLEAAQVVKELGNSEWFTKVNLSKSELYDFAGRQVVKFLITAYREPAGR